MHRLATLVQGQVGRRRSGLACLRLFAPVLMLVIVLFIFMLVLVHMGVWLCCTYGRMVVDLRSTRAIRIHVVSEFFCFGGR